MAKRIKIITSIIVWLLWNMSFVITANPRFTFDAVLTIPLTYNPFLLIKWMLWDNALPCLIWVSWMVAASCITYAYTKIYDSLWGDSRANETTE